MCIIIYAGHGLTIPEEHLRNSFQANPDGAGIMFVKDDHIVIRKGFMTIDSLLTEFAKNENFTDTDVCVHFRFATHGNKTPENCHPFPLSYNTRDLTSLNIKATRGIAHNGVILDYGGFKSTFSDTMLFVLDMAKNPCPEIDAILDTGKFCLMDTTSRQVELYGDFVNEGGIYYSNQSFRGYGSYVKTTRSSLYGEDDYGCRSSLAEWDGYACGGHGYVPKGATALDRQDTKWRQRTRTVKTRWNAPQGYRNDARWKDWEHLQEILVKMGCSDAEIIRAFDDFLDYLIECIHTEAKEDPLTMGYL